MSVFDNYAKDNLEEEIRDFLKDNTITELLDVIKWCVEVKEDDYISEKEQ